MNVVVIASEAVPFAKTGGLADVAGSLPPALRRLGLRTSLFLPCHRQARDSGRPMTDLGLSIPIPLGAKTVEARYQRSTLPGTDVDVFLVDNPAYFDRNELYGEGGADYADNSERFAFFQKAVFAGIKALDLRPDVLHCNDWQTGLIPVFLDELHREDPAFAGVGSLFTIHNIAYQGSFWHWDMPLTGLDWRLFNWRQLEFHGRLNFMKAGLVYADLLSTVSPTYAREIQTPEYGRGFDGLLRARRHDLRGVVNGIDPEVWNPAVDPKIARNYDVDTAEEGKAECRRALRSLTGLSQREEIPLLALIGRLDPQKGWDLLLEIAEPLLERDVQVVVLGTGHPRFHDQLTSLERRRPDKLRCLLKYDEDLAHVIEAGSDLFLMPSLYEPCGLTQLYSLAYGAIPIVRRTGGLADTVVDFDASTRDDGTATGFAFVEPTGSALLQAIDRALAAWRDVPTRRRLMTAGMRADWTWNRSAAAYLPIYEEIRSRARANVAAGAAGG